VTIQQLAASIAMVNETSRSIVGAGENEMLCFDGTPEIGLFDRRSLHPEYPIWNGSRS
jgi:hypothetical protein